MQIEGINNVSYKGYMYRKPPLENNFLHLPKPVFKQENSVSIFGSIKETIKDTIKVCFKTKEEKLKEACLFLTEHSKKIFSNRNILTIERLEESITKSYSKVGIKVPQIHYVNASKEEIIEIFRQNIEYLSQNGVKEFKNYLKIQEAEELSRPALFAVAMASVGGNSPDAYVDEDLKRRLTCFLSDLQLDEKFLKEKNPSQYRENVLSNLKTYEWNTKQITDLLEAFKTMSKRYFTRSGQRIEEIMNHELNGIPRVVEMAPILGIIPKGFRILEQKQLLNELMDDYKEITSLYVKDGVAPIMLKFSEQSQELNIYLEDVKKNLKGDDEYLNKKIEEISKISELRNQAYKQLFEFYSMGALNIEKLEKQIEMKTAVEFSVKLVVSFFGLPK